MTTVGLNSMQLKIQSLFQETVLKFDQEWDRHMTYLEDIVPTVMDQAAGEQPPFFEKLEKSDASVSRTAALQGAGMPPVRGQAQPQGARADGQRPQHAGLFHALCGAQELPR